MFNRKESSKQKRGREVSAIIKREDKKKRSDVFASVWDTTAFFIILFFGIALWAEILVPFSFQDIISKKGVILLPTSFFLTLLFCSVFAYFHLKIAPHRKKFNYVRLFFFLALLILPISCAVFPPLLIPDHYIPFLLLGLILPLICGKRAALFYVLLVLLLCTMRRNLGVEFLLTASIGSFCAVINGSQIRKRMDSVKAGAICGLAMWATSFAVKIYYHSSSDLLEVFSQAHATSWPFLIQGLVTGVAYLVFLPAIEHIFDIVTDITLLELSDHNHPVLRALLLNAPGTYHHSLIVGNLAEEAANAIEGNPLIARVGSYFHDIGKMKKPEYFTENDVEAEAKHSLLSPAMSSLIICSHPKDGLRIAEDYRLPSVIKEVIIGHQGTGRIEYFYNKALEHCDAGEEVDEAAFRYQGPRPLSKECAIVMLADSVEAASRSMSEATPTRLRNMVDNIIRHKIDDNQLDLCNLTLREIHLIRESFIRILSSIFHSRVKYPDND